MVNVEIPNFGELLSVHLTGVPAEAFPYLLSQLERTAAERYRDWANDVPSHSEGLLACSAREDDIADRVENLADFRRRHAPARAQQLRDGIPLEQLHHEIGPPILELSDREDFNRAAVLDVAGRQDLAVESRHGVRRRQHVSMQHLYRDLFAAVVVTGCVDGTESPC